MLFQKAACGQLWKFQIFALILDASAACANKSQITKCLLRGLMNYPVWYLPDIGGGLLIALIAITHVYISHFAVGGGLYLVLAERKGLREKNQGILDFTRSHAKFFLLMTTVFGGISGVGIWFIISLVNPAATSLLIHNFVFAWAAEWVLFLVEAVSIFVFFYTFGKMTPRTHQSIGWIYAIAAWLSLFIINGIIDFMLTPGQWIANRDFWGAFFNPTFWPALFFRSFVAFMFAGVYAFLTTAFLKDAVLKWTMTRFSGTWVLVSLLCSAPFGFWYLSALPNQARLLVEGASPTIQRALHYGLYALIAIIALTLILIILRPSFHTIPVSFLVFASAFLFMGAFEWTREASRHPYVINGVMYSTGMLEANFPAVKRDGFLSTARWSRIKGVHDERLVEAGAEIFKFQCYACHTIRGFNNDIVFRTRAMSYQSLYDYLGRIHEARYFMPPFAGNDAERKALAVYIIKGLQGKDIREEEETAEGGEKLFRAHCTICHPESLVKTRTAGWDRAKIRWALDNLNKLQPAMPDFNGAPEVKDHIADYIHSMNNPLKSGPNPQGEATP